MESKSNVVTLGETMVRLTPMNHRRIEQGGHLEMHVGGSESNTAVGLARLGVNVTWLSRLTDNPFGRWIAGTLRQYGVDTQHVRWTQEDRIGLYFLEEGKEPRGSQVHYDRKDSAASRITPADLPTELFRPGEADLFHTTGITLAISQNARETGLHAMRLAKAAGWKTSFDLNFRSKLWQSELAAQVCSEAMKLSDIIFCPVRDARLLFRFNQDLSPADIARELGEQFPSAVIVFTLGSEGSLAYFRGDLFKQGIFPADTIGRLGGGDAFSAGFLYQYLCNGDIVESLRMGAATASFKYSIPGDLPLFDAEAVFQFLKSSRTRSIER